MHCFYMPCKVKMEMFCTIFRYDFNPSLTEFDENYIKVFILFCLLLYAVSDIHMDSLKYMDSLNKYSQATGDPGQLI